MQEYTVYDSRDERRLIISDTRIANAHIGPSVMARSWLEAKDKMGFPLSDAQERLLERQRSAA